MKGSSRHPWSIPPSRIRRRRQPVSEHAIVTVSEHAIVALFRRLNPQAQLVVVAIMDALIQRPKGGAR